MNLELSLIISQIIAFIIMLLILRRYAWRPLLKIMKERKRKIEAEFDSIEEQRNEIKKLREEFNDKLKRIEEEAKAKIQEGVDAGQKAAKEIEETARQQAKGILNKAKEDIGHEINQAKKDLKKDLVNIVIGATEKLLHEKVDPEINQKLVGEFVDQSRIT